MEVNSNCKKPEPVNADFANLAMEVSEEDWGRKNLPHVRDIIGEDMFICRGISDDCRIQVRHSTRISMLYFVFFLPKCCIQPSFRLKEE